MAARLLSERDLEVLRSFASRVDPADAGAHNNLGVLYFNKGLLDEAIAAFTRALELDARMRVAARNLEIAYYSTGYYDRRVSELERRLAVEPRDREARWEMARTHALLGDHARARREFAMLLDDAPYDHQVLLQLGLAEKALGDLDAAQHLIERATALGGDDPAPHAHLGELLYHRGRTAEAAAALRRALAFGPEQADVHYLYGFVLGELGHHEEARAATQRAVRLNPSLARAQANLSLDTANGRIPATPSAVPAVVPPPDQARPQASGDSGLAHYSLGVAFRQRGYLDEALHEYALALELGEARDLVLQATAEVQLLRRDAAAAEALYAGLCTDACTSPKLWNEYGVSLQQQGRIEQAAAAYGAALRYDAGYVLALNNLAVALVQQADAAGAAQRFTRALELAPEFLDARRNLALLHHRAGRHDDALDAYRKVLAHSPEDAGAWNGIALVLTALGRPEDARGAFGRALRARPEFAEAHYGLGFALSALGDYAGALRAARRGMELDPYYVAPTFRLTIDLQHEDGGFAVHAELEAESRDGAVAGGFVVEEPVLDALFVSLDQPGLASAVDGSALAAARRALAEGRTVDAIAAAGAALAGGCEPVPPLLVLGDAYARQGLHGEAFERFTAVLAAVPDDRPARLGAARALVALGRTADAAPLLRPLLDAGDADPDVFLVHAAVCEAANDPAGELCALRRARVLAPTRGDVLHHLGRALVRRGDVAEAVGAFRAALELDGALIAARVDLATVLAASGDTPGATGELRTATRLLPSYAPAALALSRLCRGGQDAAAALPALVELLHCDPAHVESLVELGDLLLDLRRPADALVALRRAIRLEPDSAMALAVAGDAFAEDGRDREARDCWYAAVALDSKGPVGARALVAAERAAERAADQSARIPDDVQRLARVA